ncbi:MAG: SBBP repeat-containing protein [bacterium]|nr:SBBP repeat-containing protein [bacterium]
MLVDAIFRRIIGSVIVLLGVTVLTAGLSTTVRSTEPSVSVSSISPTCFIQNCGQWPDSILFQTKVNGAVVWFGRYRLYYQLFNRNEAKADSADQFLTRLVYEELVGANRNAEVVGENESNYYCNYFLGNDSTKWTTDVPTFSSIRYYDIYPGIDLRYYYRNGHLEYDFLLSPNADPLAIQIKYQGIDSLITGADGELIVATDWGKIIQQPPFVYEASSGQLVGCEYRIEGNSLGFAVQLRLDELAIVIDPVLLFSSYLGGSENDQAYDVEVDGRGNVYVAGQTMSSDFPNVGFPITIVNWDMFITKLEPRGRDFIYSTFIGGQYDEHASSIKVHTKGDLLVGGQTSSYDIPLYRPVQTSRDGPTEGILLRINDRGNLIRFCTYFGGSVTDTIADVGFDSVGNAYFCGHTCSPDLPLKNAFHDFTGLECASFLVKMPPFGDSLISCTYVGSSAYRLRMAVDKIGQVHLASMIWEQYYPMYRPFQVRHNVSGSADGAVTKFAPDLKNLVFSTVLAGSYGGYFNGIAFDQEGRVYAAGGTSSNDYPVINRLKNMSGNYEGVISILDSSGQHLLFSTFWGAGPWAGLDEIRDVAVDSQGYIYALGIVNDWDFPLKNAFDSQTNHAAEVTITKIAPLGQEIVYSSFLGGAGSDGAVSVAVDDAGNAYIAGITGSGDFAMVNPLDSTIAGGDWPSDAFIAIVSDELTNIDDPIQPTLPSTFVLHQNYPNPFNGETVIEFDLPRTADIDLSVYNVLGERICTLVDGTRNVGTHSIRWDGTDDAGQSVASGVYFCHLSTEMVSFRRKMVLLK